MEIDKRLEILELLIDSPAKLVYKKLDGTTRTILCTRCWSYVRTDPDQNYLQPKKQNKINTMKYIIIWDLENKSFRKLIYDKIKTYKRSKYKNKTRFINK